MVPPSHTRPSSGAVPATWKSGATARSTSSRSRLQASVLWNALATRFRWVSTTPLDRPVVPPVKKMAAGSSSDVASATVAPAVTGTPTAEANGEPGSAGGAAPASSASYSAPKRIVASTTSPNWPGSRSARRMRAPERLRASRSSGSAWRVFRGTITKPAAGTARWAST